MAPSRKSSFRVVKGGTFDPSAHTVAVVNKYLANLEPGSEERTRVLRAERAGKARAGVLKKKAAPRRGKSAAPKNVAEAAASNNQRALLVAMRDRIAQAVASPSCPPRDLASLTRRLQDIAEKIEALDLREQDEADDETGAEVDDSYDASAV